MSSGNKYHENDKSVLEKLQFYQIELELQNEELRKTKQQLEVSTNKFSDLYDFAPIGYFTFDARGTFLEANFTGCEMLNLHANELIGKSFRDFVDESDWDKIQLYHKKVIRTKEKLSTEIKLVTSNGDSFFGEMISLSVYDSEAGRMHIRSAIIDISERKKAEEELKQAHEQLEERVKERTLELEKANKILVKEIKERKEAENLIRIQSAALNAADISVILVDTKGKIEWVNPAFLKLTGYTADEVIGKKDKFLANVKKDKELYKKIWFTISSGRVWRGVLPNSTKNGTGFYEELTITPVKDDSGNTLRFISIQQDITHRIKAEEDLIKAKELAENSDKLKSEFLAQITHEIRTPLNALLCFSSLIRDDLADKVNDDLKTSFNLMHRSSNRLVRTIDLMLNMSEIQTGTYDYNPKNLDLFHDVLSSIHNEYDVIAKDKNLTFSISQKTSDTYLFADEYTVHQIFLNLVDNAIKYTSNGSVNVIIDRNRNGELKVDVADTGIGISKDYLSKIFTPFSQEEQGYTRRFEGNGLGLAVVKNYCQLNNATISVKSDKGKGTKFSVVFPKLNMK